MPTTYYIRSASSYSDTGAPGTVVPGNAGGTYLTNQYRYVIADLDGNELDEVPAKNFVFTEALNAPGSINFELALRHKKTTKSLLAIGEREIHIYRNDIRVGGGYLWSFDASVNEGHVRFAGEGFLSRFAHRQITDTKTYVAGTSVQEDIAWDLINYTQAKANGNLGITRGNAAQSTRTRDRTYYANERKVVLEALQELASVIDGFDFEITPDKKFNTYYPQKGRSLDVVLEYAKNVPGFGLQADAHKVENHISGFGSGTGSAQTIAEVSDEASQARFRLMEGSRSYSDINDAVTINNHLTEDLRLVKDGFILPNASVMFLDEDPGYGAFSVGDVVEVRCQIGFIDYAQKMRISTVTVNISNEGKEALNLGFDDPIGGTS